MIDEEIKHVSWYLKGWNQLQYTEDVSRRIITKKDNSLIFDHIQVINENKKSSRVSWFGYEVQGYQSFPWLRYYFSIFFSMFMPWVIRLILFMVLLFYTYKHLVCGILKFRFCPVSECVVFTNILPWLWKPVIVIQNI